MFLSSLATKCASAIDEPARDESACRDHCCGRGVSRHCCCCGVSTKALPSIPHTARPSVRITHYAHDLYARLRRHRLDACIHVSHDASMPGTKARAWRAAPRKPHLQHQSCVNRLVFGLLVVCGMTAPDERICHHIISKNAGVVGCLVCCVAEVGHANIGAPSCASSFCAKSHPNVFHGSCWSVARDYTTSRQDSTTNNIDTNMKSCCTDDETC